MLGMNPGEPTRPDVPITPPYQPVQPPAYYPPLPQRKSHAGLIVGLVAIGLAVLLGAGVGVYFLTRSKPAPKGQTAQERASQDCQAAVKGRLKAPATAQFS